MRKSAIVFCAVTAANMLVGAMLFASSGTQAMPVAGHSGLNTAIHQANAAQKVAYICRQGSYGRRCYYVSRPDRNPRYARPYANGGDNWDQAKTFVGNPRYNAYQWGGAMGEGN